jgi:epoxyqueuosine reductase
MTRQPLQLSQFVKSAANDAGFDWCGICPAVEPAGLSRFYQWIEAGFHGEMNYLESRSDAYSHPSRVMDGAKSIVMLALNYAHQPPAQVRPGQGRVSRYAWGSVDYHDLIHDRLRLLQRALAERAPELNTRGVVDTAPLMEREFAVLAGLGWQGKNTLLLNKQAGSWFFLASLLVDEVLEYDEPHNTSHCGTCRACLDRRSVCP